MTDRPIFYSGEIPLSTDVLFAIRATMIGIGNLAQMCFGTATVFSGLSVSPTSPASLSVSVGPGTILANTVVDSTTYGVLAADSDALVKIGINTEATTLGPFTAPVTSGQSVDILVEAAFSETDGTAVVLPYFNSANPSSPFSGPANTGTAQNTRRLQTVALNVVVGTPATTGSQTVPSVSAGYVGVAVITIANGATTITSGNITTYAGAPIVSAPLGALTVAYSNKVTLTSGSAWTVPAGITRVKATVIGAGGGGSVLGGGGGGGVSSGTLTGLTPGSSLAVSIGAAGAGASSGAAGNGGTTTFAGVFTANGGSGANGSTGGAGGTASGGASNASGLAGALGGFFGATIPGQGGANGLGQCGAPVSTGGGVNGAFSGVGGNGAQSASTGGSGGAGSIILEY